MIRQAYPVLLTTAFLTVAAIGCRGTAPVSLDQYTSSCSDSSCTDVNSEGRTTITDEGDHYTIEFAITKIPESAPLPDPEPVTRLVRRRTINHLAATWDELKSGIIR